jgi:predicted TIM-barrel fold metal-dependent hydrolase
MVWPHNVERRAGTSLREKPLRVDWRAQVYVDADTHIMECEDTWSYMPAAEQDLVPRTLAFAPGEAPPWLHPTRQRFWFIEGQLQPKRIVDDLTSGTTEATRCLYDVPARLKDMDDLGVELQVIYPTLFLKEVTRRGELQAALYRSYNRWLADRCSQSNGRLRWIALVPYASPSDALDEITFAKENGACGLFKLGLECGDLSASDSYFFPFYRRALELGMPICIHQGQPWSAVNPVVGARNAFNRATPPISAFVALIVDKVPERFPGLRFGFIELGSSWLPHAIDLARLPDWLARERGDKGYQSLEDFDFFITCQAREELPHLLRWAGTDRNFMIGSDYSHNDIASVKDAHGQVVQREDLSAETAARITSENAARFYGL